MSKLYLTVTLDCVVKFWRKITAPVCYS